MAKTEGFALLRLVTNHFLACNRQRATWKKDNISLGRIIKAVEGGFEEINLSSLERL